MDLKVSGDGDHLEVHLHLEWRRLAALLKAIIATLIVVASLLAELTRLGILPG